MNPGSVSIPVRGSKGFYLLALVSERVSQGSDLPLPEPKTQVTLSQLIVPLPPGAAPSLIQSQRARAEALRARAGGSCESFDALAQETGSSASGRLGTFQLNQARPDLRQRIATLPENTPSAVAQSPEGFSILMVCERVVEEAERESEEEKRLRIRNSLLSERLAVRERQYLRDLQRSANIEHKR